MAVMAEATLPRREAGARVLGVSSRSERKLSVSPFSVTVSPTDATQRVLPSGEYPRVALDTGEHLYAAPVPNDAWLPGRRPMAEVPIDPPKRTPRLPIDRYARLCAAIEADPSQLLRLSLQLGLGDEGGLAEEDAAWREAFARDAGVFELFMELKWFGFDPSRDLPGNRQQASTES